MQPVSTLSATALNPELWRAAATGTARRVRAIIKAGGDPKAFNSLALRWAAEAGNKRTTKELLKSDLPLADVKQSLRIAVGDGKLAKGHNGHHQTARILRKWIANAERPKGAIGAYPAEQLAT